MSVTYNYRVYIAPQGTRKRVGFNGVNSYVDLQGFRYPQMTLCFWVNPDYQIAGVYNYHKDIIRKGDEWGISTHAYFNDNKHILINYRYFGCSEWWVECATPLNILQRNFISVIWNMSSGTIKAIINNSTENFNVGSGTMWTDEFPLKIASGGAGPFRGVFDEIRIYNRVLSDSEIQTLYNGGNVTDGLVLYLPGWSFLEDKNKWWDMSGNGNHGTNYGAYPVFD